MSSSIMPWVILIEVFSGFFAIAMPWSDHDLGFVAFCSAIIFVVVGVVAIAIWAGSNPKPKKVEKVEPVQPDVRQYQ